MIRRAFLAAILMGLAAPSASIATTLEHEYGTPEEAIAMAERAVALINDVGFEAASVEFHRLENKDYHDRDLYVFALDSQGVNLVHGVKPHIVGNNLYDITDVNGDYYVRDLIAAGQSGIPQWVDYWLDSPATGTIVQKSSYIIPVSDDLFVGVGIYRY